MPDRPAIRCQACAAPIAGRAIQVTVFDPEGGDPQTVRWLTCRSCSRRVLQVLKGGQGPATVVHLPGEPPSLPARPRPTATGARPIRMAVSRGSRLT